MPTARGCAVWYLTVDAGRQLHPLPGRTISTRFQVVEASRMSHVADGDPAVLEYRLRALQGGPSSLMASSAAGAGRVGVLPSASSALNMYCSRRAWAGARGGHALPSQLPGTGRPCRRSQRSSGGRAGMRAIRVRAQPFPQPRKPQDLSLAIGAPAHIAVANSCWHAGKNRLFPPEKEASGNVFAGSTRTGDLGASAKRRALADLLDDPVEVAELSGETLVSCCQVYLLFPAVRDPPRRPGSRLQLPYVLGEAGRTARPAGWRRGCLGPSRSSSRSKSSTASRCGRSSRLSKHLGTSLL